MSGTRPGRGGRDVAGVASAGTSGTSDSSETAGDADLLPGHHGHGRALRPRIGHLGHRLTCGAAPGRGTWGCSPFTLRAVPGITSRPFVLVPGWPGRAVRPLPVRGSRSASSHAARADEGSDGAPRESTSSAAVVPSYGRRSKASLEPAVAAGLWGRPSRPGCTSRIRHDQIKSHPWTHTARRRASTVLTKAAARARLAPRRRRS